jgi:hypothetical protein
MLAGLIKRLGEIETNASNNNQSAAVSALIAQAKLAGLWVDRTENRNANVNYGVEPLAKPLLKQDR